jgi:uncharacterized protein YbjT (DUF2867 family)
MKALLLGASGLTGGNCLKMLLDDNFYNEVEIWVRKPLGISHAKLTEKIIDFEKLSAFTTDANHVFCCIGTTIKKAKSKENFFKTDHDYVVTAAEIARLAGAKKFMYISSIGASAQSKNFYLRTKGKVEEDLKKVFPDGLYIFRPSMLIGKREEFRFGEKMGKGFMQTFGFIFSGKLKKYRGIEASVVALAMIHEAKSDKTGINIIESDKISELVTNR